MPRNLLFIVMILLFASPAPGQDTPQRSWWRKTTVETSRYYSIKTDLPAAQAQPLAAHFDRMYEEYSRRLASLAPREPEKLNILLFERQVDYLHVLRTRYGVDATGSGGMFFVNQRGTAFALWTGGLPQTRVFHVMQHEGFHQFAFSRFGGDLPIWINEGMAEFFGEAVLIGDTFILGQTTPRVLASIRQHVDDGEYIPFTEMLGMSSEVWGDNVKFGRGAFQYRQAWSMVQFLVYGENGRYQAALEKYLRKLNRAIPPETAWREVFGPNVLEFEAAWKRYAKAAKPSSFMTATERIEFLAEGSLELSRHGITCKSMEELELNLKEIGFVQELRGHDQIVRLLASDHENFVIPPDDLCREPSFEVKWKRPRLGSPRERRWEESQPTPAIIRTDGLAPNQLTVEWIRRPKTGELSYRIIVK